MRIDNTGQSVYCPVLDKGVQPSLSFPAGQKTLKEIATNYHFSRDRKGEDYMVYQQLHSVSLINKYICLNPQFIILLSMIFDIIFLV